jgi:cell wall-associated NlpC family hydrolase
VPASVRRRRAAGLLAGLTLLGVAAAAVSALTVLWGVVALLGVLTTGYALAAGAVRRRAARRELTSAFGSAAPARSTIDWGELDQTLRLVDHGGGAVEAAPGGELTPVAVVRFTAAYVAALALTPAVFVLRLIGGDLSDLERHDVVGRLVRFQDHWRSQSLRMLTASVAATATVAVVGAAGSAAFASPVASVGASYTVQAGDTLSSIAEANGTTVAALVSANELADPNLILVGQVLSLGTATASAPTAATAATVPAATAAGSSSDTYVVQSGDTLGSIAANEGTTWGALASANDLSNPNLIFVGEVLTLPGGSSAAQPTASTVSAVTPAPAATTAPATPAPAPATTPPPPAPAAAPTPVTPATLVTADPSSASPPAPAAPTSAASVAVQTALAEVGVPYVYGGASPAGFDCSGLVMYAYAAAGVSLPHYTVSQYDDTTRISEADLEPGDLVFYDTGDGAQPGHVAMYIGNGSVVSANTTGTNVQTQSITYDGTPMGFGRVG